jgi:FtsZ-binding cell division protein ZapB
LDFLRPEHGACLECGGPKEIVDNSCFFCGCERTDGEMQHVASQAAPAHHAIKQEHQQEEKDQQDEQLDDSEVVCSLRREVAALRLENCDLKAQLLAVAPEQSELSELRARLNEAMEARQRIQAEVEALKAANKSNQLRNSRSKLRNSRSKLRNDSNAKPLPSRPARVPAGLVRESSASQIGAGRGK